MKNEIIEDKAGEVEGRAFAQKVQEWYHKNSLLSLQANYGITTITLIAEFQNCLISDQNFDTERLKKEIEQINQQMAIGNDILLELITTKDVQLIELQGKILLSMERLKNNMINLINFFNKIKFLPEYKTDIKKYKRAIESTLKILAPEKDDTKTPTQ